VHHTLTGNFGFHKSFQSRFLRNPRDIIVYLPPGYDSAGGARYPVLYMHDGQNLFDAATAFAGNEWGLDETCEELIQAGQIEPLIVVGIYNAGVERIAEYTHVKDRRGQGGRARAYGKLLMQELKPFIDSEYRTLTGAADTGLGGSSLGGLATLYLGLRHPGIFSRLMVMSPSVWWSNRAILREVSRAAYGTQQKIWLDIGTAEDRDPEISVRHTVDLRDALIAKGWQPSQDLEFLQDEGAGHNEQAWGRRVRDALRFLFPPRVPS